MATYIERNRCKENDIQRPAEGAVVDSSKIAIGADLCADGIYNHLVGDCCLNISNMEKAQLEYVQEEEVIFLNEFKGYIINSTTTINKDCKYEIPHLSQQQYYISNQDVVKKANKKGQAVNLFVEYIMSDPEHGAVVYFKVIEICAN